MPSWSPYPPGALTGVATYKNSDLDATAKAASTGAKKIREMKLDNSANAAATFFKFWDVAVGSVTVGTTVPTMIIKVAAGQTLRVRFLPTGLSFATAITVAAVTTGGTGGTTNPTSDAAIAILMSS